VNGYWQLEKMTEPPLNITQGQLIDTTAIADSWKDKMHEQCKWLTNKLRRLFWAVFEREE
jgi:hypothetical protein